MPALRWSRRTTNLAAILTALLSHLPANTDARPLIQVPTDSLMPSFRSGFWTCITVAALLATAAPHALAQRQMAIADQPGHIPDAAEEQLPSQFQRQVVLYRSNEAPGTIIVHTSERFLYVVQPNGRACATASASAATGFNGRACCTSPASRNGPIGRRRRK